MFRLTLIRLMMCITCLSLPTLAAAHEVRPAIADLSIEGGVLSLDIRLNAEAIVAGVDLDGIEDTDQTGASHEVDALRALAAKDIEARLASALPDIFDVVSVVADAGALDLQADSIKAGPIGDTSLPRDTVLALRATVPDNAEWVQVLWPAEFGTLILRQQGVEEPYTGYLTGGAASERIDVTGGQSKSFWQSFVTYIPVGFDHILPLGLDHILFVLGLFFLSPQPRALLWQVSAFTLAHTVTLALGALGLVNVPGHIVEPLIAASIVYVAVENLFTTNLHRWRPLVIFGFGLLHGLGFASVLGEFGLPQDQFIAALIGFNVGVEFGQITVIAVAFLISFAVLSRGGSDGSARLSAGFLVAALVILPLLLIPLAGMTEELKSAGIPLIAAMALIAGFCANAAYTGGPQVYRRLVALPASTIIALVGAFWVIERVFL